MKLSEIILAVVLLAVGGGGSVARAQSVGTSSVVAHPTDERITLREYVDQRFDWQQQAVASALAAADRAVTKAEIQADKRFESVNEFRASLNDNNRLQMPRAEAEQQFKTLNEKIDLMQNRVNANEARSQGVTESWGFVIGGLGVLCAAASVAYNFVTRPSQFSRNGATRK